MDILLGPFSMSLEFIPHVYGCFGTWEVPIMSLSPVYGAFESSLSGSFNFEILITES